MEQNGHKVTQTVEQLYAGAVALLEQSGKDGEAVQHDGMFLCSYNNHWVPIGVAAKKGENPSICKAYSAEKREQSRLREEEERAQKQASIDKIPSIEQRGGTKRVTFSLTKYTVAALDVLAVGKTTSEIVEKAIIQLLQQEDPQVIAFIGHIFSAGVK